MGPISRFYEQRPEPNEVNESLDDTSPSKRLSVPNPLRRLVDEANLRLEGQAGNEPFAHSISAIFEATSKLSGSALLINFHQSFALYYYIMSNAVRPVDGDFGRPACTDRLIGVLSDKTRWIESRHLSSRTSRPNAIAIVARRGVDPAFSDGSRWRRTAKNESSRNAPFHRTYPCRARGPDLRHSPAKVDLHHDRQANDLGRISEIAKGVLHPGISPGNRQWAV